MADDLGIGDVKCYGKERGRIETPHMDSLAAEGVRFTEVRASASFCVPVRVAIMAGRYSWRFGEPGPGGPWGYLGTQMPPGQHTLATMLKSVGYQTGYVGKWHLGTLMETTDGKNQGLENVDYTKPLRIGPTQYGFDYSFILPGSLDMYPYVFVRNGEFVGRVTKKRGWSAFNRVGPAADDFEDYKVIGEFAREAEEFIARRAAASRSEPFFLYFALASPHTPISPSPAFEGKSELGLYGDFVMETDAAVGRITAALERHNLDASTLVIVTSDHGPAPYAGNARKATFANMYRLERKGHFPSLLYRGYKGSAYDGGLRVPLIARWPAVAPAGSICDRMVGLNDLMATLADVTSARLGGDQAPDSISFAPLLRNPTARGARRYFISTNSKRSTFTVHDRYWKLIIDPGSGDGGPWGNESEHEAWKTALGRFGRPPTRADLRHFPFVQLFDLSEDPYETTNLAERRPEVVTRLFGVLDQQIARGRSTPGKPLQNDAEGIDYHGRVRPWVLR
jgi:arylsulfatase A-like enzyme